jgi:toxin ParE1/3/4
MTVVWSRRALRHLVALRGYIERDSEASAALVAGRIVNAVDRLESHPELGRPGRIFGTRELVVPGTPFLIAYRVRGGRLELIAVLHGRQRWPGKF